MDRLYQQVLMWVFAAFIICGLRELIAGPEEREILPNQPPAAAVLTAYVPSSPVPQPDVPPTRQHARHAVIQQREDGCLMRREVLHAGNGWPITGRSYVRTVYTVCPLEDMPG
ncbi:MAG: hypothetical protein IJZ74_02945 [Clostridia bacterium]|nr:hypothetical protein [Clostridia bacterium]